MNNFFKRIINNLARPYKIPKKIFNKLNYYSKYKYYNKNFFEKKQNEIFKNFGLSREEGIRNLIVIKKKIDFDLRNIEMSSEHEIIFSSLSLIENKSISDILEIGTFDGFNSLLLSNLFPNSNVDTIDLPEDDGDFINFYNRRNSTEDFVQKRDIILSKNKNINFFPVNSLKLLNNEKKYDLIWIDGAHGYPVVCIDIINSLYALKKNGLILCDDVYLKLNQSNSDNIYSSIATYETLNELKKQNLINFRLAYKRLNAKDNCVENERKFIAIVSKI
jgi:predicted O-methyltransferase YrrM